jgi:restriction system protein
LDNRKLNKINHQQVAEYIRALAELLWNKPDGAQASEIIAFIPQIIPLTEFEKEYVPFSNMPRYERYLRLATIPLVKAGWLTKSNKGKWVLTEEGKEACHSYPSAVNFYDAAVKQLEDVHMPNPGMFAEAEKAEEKAWEQIQEYILGLNRWEFSLLVRELFISLGYFIVWTAPSDKNHGKIDLVLSIEPLGGAGKNIFVHIKHSGEPMTLGSLQRIFASINSQGHGVIICTAGFEDALKQTYNKDMQSKITLIDLENFFDLWVKQLSKHSPEALLRFPLKIVHFLAGMPR